MGKRKKVIEEVKQDELTKQQELDAIIDQALTQDRTVEVALDSLEAKIGYGSLIRELQHGYLERVAFNRSEMGGSLSLDEARALAYHTCKDEAEAKRIYDKLMSYPLDIISFVDLLEMWPVAPRIAEGFWEMMKSEARDGFESGHLASEAMYPVHYMRTAWHVASYLGLRESLITEWQPRGGIELSLIDMLAQAFLQYQHWVKQSVLRSETREREVHPEYEQWQRWKKPEQQDKSGFLDGYWFRPFLSERNAIEHAAQMADRWNRIYMRTLRNLRDLRRYSVPVTINNPQQVNIAADGGQQVNVRSD
ncbi:MAG: hypothetical protein ACJ74W_23420 [Pyrinomonadaceae bacterium]